jgi:hypothetical protein
LRLYKFYPALNKVAAVTYSPYLNEYDTSTYGQFEFFLEMSSNCYAISTQVVSGNGTIIADPATVMVNSGRSSIVNLSPDSGYGFSIVTDNGADVTSLVVNNTYAITGITTDHMIAVTFAEIPLWDLNADRVCDVSDLVAIGLHWEETGEDGWITQDINKDGVIDVADLVVIGLHWGATW